MFVLAAKFAFEVLLIDIPATLPAALLLQRSQEPPKHKHCLARSDLLPRSFIVRGRPRQGEEGF